MNRNDLPYDPDEPLDIGDQNIERLLGLAYLPEEADAEFVRRLEARLCGVARAEAAARAEAGRLWRPRFPWRALVAAGLAAALLGPALCLHLLPHEPSALVSNAVRLAHGEAAAADPPPSDAPNVAAPEVATAPGKTAPAAAGWLTALTRSPAPAVTALAVGEIVETGKGECRLAGLSDGSLVYINGSTRVQLAADRQLKLSSGEVYLEVAPPQEEAAPFLIVTDERRVEALATKMTVRADENGTGVVVARGKAKVSGVDDLVGPGQQVAADSNNPAPAPRASYLLDWTRDLMTASESPLVPQSSFGGGALVARNPLGQETRLSLRKYHIDVHLEDGFARTTIDQTYFNHEAQRLEGTFHFPLPADASLSRLAMYVDGKLMEGGMVERDHGRAVYEDIVRRMQDPALLEWVDGSTFKMRVFPLEGRQEKRIVLSYTQQLPTLYGQGKYRFPAGHSLEVVRDWSFHARVKNGAQLEWSCDSHELQAKTDGGDLLLDARAKQVKIDQDVRLTLTAGPPREDRPRFSSFEHEGARYLMLRYRPALPASSELKTQNSKLATPRNWVFLFESSADRDPLLARVQVDVVRSLLNHVEADDTFAVLTAGTRARAFASEPRPATRANVKEAVAFLEQAHLIGALDLGTALATAEPLLKARPNAYLVHVGSGTPALGERREDVLAKRVPEEVRYVGVGVGKRWARGLMKAAAERTGGYFTQINPDEPVAWRAFDLFAALRTPRLLDVKVVDAAERATFLCPDSALSQGEELCAVARVGPGEPVPEAVVISGTLEGQPFRKEVPVRDVAGGAGYLPRTWAKWEIDRLLAEDAAANRDRVVALSKAMYVMTPYTSLLVLENEAMYAQYKVDRGRKDHWAMYPCPATIPVVHEPLHIEVTSISGGGAAGDKRPGVDEVLASVLVRVPPPILTFPGESPDDRAAYSVVRAFDYYRRDQAIRVLLNAGLTEGLRTERKPEGRPTAEGAVKYYETHTAQELLEHGLMRPELYRNEKELRLLEELVKKSMAEQAQSSSIRPPGSDPKTTNAPNLNPYSSATFADPKFYGMGGPRISGPSATAPDVQTATAPRPVMTVAPTGTLGQGGGFHSNGTTAFGGGFGGYTYLPPGFNSFGGGFNGFGGQAGFGGFNGAFTSGLNGVVPTTSGPGGSAPANYGFPIGTGGTSSAGSSTTAPPPRPPQAAPPFDPTTAKPVSAVPPADSPAPVPPPSGGVPASPHSLPAPGDSMPGLGARYSVPMLGPVKTTLDMDFLRAREAEREQLFQFWLGFFGDAAARPARNRQAQTQGADAPGNWLYRRPTFSGDPRVFRDLVSYAPGMNTQPADILAVVETETAAAPAPGQVAPAARALIDRARSAGWQALTLPGTDGFRLVCDGSGRYAWDRVLPVGLREQVVCDGKTLVHLYSEIGLGARRAVSRFHRAELAELVPWFVPPAEDLARGADLVCADERTVAIVPHGADQARAADGKPLPYLRTHLVFAGGRLAERRLVEVPSARVVATETCALDGTVRLLDDAGKEVAVRRLKTEPAAAPGLRPDLLRDLVVLPLPLRTPPQIAAMKRLPPDGNYTALDEEMAQALVGALFAVNSNELAQVVAQRYLKRGDQRLGFHVLLTAAGLDSDQLTLPKNHSHQPLARYLAGLRRGTPDGKLARTEAAGNAFLQRLVALHDLHRLGPRPKGNGERPAPDPLERKLALESLRAGKASSLDWALLSLAQERLGEDEEMEKAIGTGLRKLADAPDLNYIAEYERARLSLTNGRQQEARELYQELYTRAAKYGAPPLDSSFRAAFQTAGKDSGADAWAGWARQTAARLAEQDQRRGVLTLVWQCHEFGDAALAGQLLDLALAGADRSAERVPVTLAAAAFLTQTGQYARADELVQPLLAERELADSAALWRLGAWLAGQRRQTARAFACLERALDLEYRQADGVIELESLRRDYGSLLGYYEQRANAFATLQQGPPAEFVPRVVRAADRWRAFDPDDTAACQAAARVLKAVGAADLAWDYLTTTPSPGDGPTPWLNLAQSLHDEGQLELAGRAYALAFEAEPTNPQPLWDRARVLEEDGKSAEARRLIRRIAEGEWPAQFGELKTQARQQAASQMAKPASSGR